MSYFRYLVANDMARERLENDVRSAEMHRRLSQLGLLRESRFFRTRCWLLSQAGRTLVNLGKRLEKFSLAQARVPRGHTSGDT